MRLALFVASAAWLVGCGSPLPPASAAVLAEADTFEVLALDPGGPEAAEAPPAETFHGFKIVAKAAVPSREAQKRIVDIVDDGVRSGGTRAKCFNPRHGIHAVKAGHVVDLVICYQCGEVDLHDGSITRDLDTADVRAKLDVEMKAVGVTALPD